MASKQRPIPPSAYFSHNDDENDPNRIIINNGRSQTLLPRTFLSDQLRAKRASELRMAASNAAPNSSTPQAYIDPNVRFQKRERRETFVVPPRNARRMENPQSSLKAMQERHRRDIELGEVICHDAGVRMGRQYGAPEGSDRKVSIAEESMRMEEKEHGEARRSGITAEEKSAAHQRRDVERQGAAVEVIARSVGWSKRPFSDSKTCNIFFDWLGMISCFYVGVLLLVAFLTSTLYLAMHPADALAVMTLDTTLLFNGGSNSGNSPAGRCSYELRPPSSTLMHRNETDFGHHKSLYLNTAAANVTIPRYIDLHMFGYCFNGQLEPICRVGNPLLPLNWNITGIVEKSIMPTLEGLDPKVEAGLYGASLKADLIKEIAKKAKEANPKPAIIDILAWGWPLPVWPKPSSLSTGENGGATRSVLLLNNRIFDGEVRKGDVTALPYNVLMITMVAGIFFLGILILCLIVMGPQDQLNFTPCWVGCVLLSIPFAILAIVGATFEAVGNGSSGWREDGCNIIEYAGAALRPFWIRDFLQWYFWGLVVAFGGFACAYLVKGTISRNSLWNKQNFGGCGFVGFCILSFLALIVASVTGQRSMATKAKTINSMSNFLGMRAVPGKGYWIAVCLAEFLALWIGLACVATAFNFKFRERNRYFLCKTSNDTAADGDVKTRSGARISAPFMTTADTRDVEKVETAENDAAKDENDMRPVEQAHQHASSGPHQTAVPPLEEVTVEVKEIEETDADGSDDQMLEPAVHDDEKEKAREVLEIAAAKEESEVESGVALSSAPTHNGVLNAVGEGQDTGMESGDETTIGEFEGRREDDEEGHGDSRDGEEVALHRHATSSEDHTAMNDSWSCQAEASRSGRTTAASISRSEGYDGVDESSRGGTPSISSGLESYHDGVSGSTKYRTRQGHVFEMVTRLSRHSEISEK